MSPDAAVIGTGEEWVNWLACARCRAPLETTDGPACAQCGLPWSRDGNVIRWGSPPPPRGPRARGLGDHARSLAYRLDPFASPYSPLTALTRARTERYYRRALAGDHLAQSWARHYLRRIDLPARAAVLDHGCGRGRVSAFLARLGHRVVGQDVEAHPWWRELRNVGFAVVPGGASGLPWRDRRFHLVVNSMVIGHLPPHELAGHAREVHRCLMPGGTWLVVEANAGGFGTAPTRRFYGRLHALAEVRRLARAAGYVEVDQWFEGVRSPVAPRLVSFLRMNLSWKGWDIADHGAWLERIVRPERRAMWVLALRRPG